MQNESAVWALLTMHMVALAVACMFCLGIVIMRRRAQRLERQSRWQGSNGRSRSVLPRRPVCWLAIRAASPSRVQAALGLSRPAPCSWSEGMTGEHEFFISPRVNGWVIVTGVAIPAPDDDVDECFRFLVSLSAKLGHVQFFHAEEFSHYHAWARLDEGCVTRAYAWAGQTVWNQGKKTMPELQLGLRCFGYGEECPLQVARENVKKVARLAARWNFDPRAIDATILDHAVGVAGQVPRMG